MRHVPTRMFRYAGLLVLVLLVGCGQEKKITSRSPEALRYYEEGVSLCDQFYYAEAESVFQRSLAQDSTLAMTWARLAAIHWATRNEPQALTAIGKALRYSQQATQREQLFISMWNSYMHYAFDDAARLADSLIQLHPDESEAYLFRGGLYDMKKNYDAAVRMYQKSIEADTGYALGVMMLGYAYSNQGDHDKALQQMERYIRLAPKAADSRASYADLLVRVGRYDDALEQYRKSLELKPDYWYAFQETGRIYLTLGRLTEAEQQYDKSFSFLPQRPQLKASRLALDAQFNAQRGKYTLAIERSLEALSVDSLNLSAASSLVYALAKTKKFDDANQVLARIRQELQRRNLTESPVMQDHFLMKATLFVEQNRLVDAQACCDSALQFSSPLTRGSIFRQLAEIRLKEKSFDKALDACEEALRVNSNFPSGLLTLTKVYAALGDKTMTREIGGRLLALWKNADADFQSLLELRRLLKSPAAAH